MNWFNQGPTPKLPPTREQETAQRARWASTVCWIISVVFTVLAAVKGISKSNDVNVLLIGFHPLLPLAISIILAVAGQYALSLAETPVFNGTVPMPWDKAWKWNGPNAGMLFMACSALLVDILLNMNGSEWLFSAELDAGGLGSAAQDIVTLILAGFVAGAPELLRSYADELDRKPQQPQSVEPVLVAAVPDPILTEPIVANPVDVAAERFNRHASHRRSRRAVR